MRIKLRKRCKIIKENEMIYLGSAAIVDKGNIIGYQIPGIYIN